MNTAILKKVPLAKIIQAKNHRETYHETDELASLMGSIQDIGLQSPIRVIPVKSGKYRIIYGHRRFIAAKKLRIHALPCFIEKANLTDSEINIQNLMENIQRKNPSPIEYGLAFQKMMNDEKYTAKELAIVLSKSESFIDSCIYAANKIPKQHRNKIVIQRDSNKRKKNTIPLYSAKKIEGARKKNKINREESNVLYDLAKKGSPSREIISMISSITKGANFKEAIKKEGKGRIIRVSFSMEFFQNEVGPDKASFQKIIKDRIYKELNFSRP